MKNKALLAIREKLNEKAKSWYGENNGKRRQEQDPTPANTKTTINAALKRWWGGEIRSVYHPGSKRVSHHALVWLEREGPEPHPPP